MKKKLNKQGSSRREFVKKAAYVAPAILTLQAAPEFARAASRNSESPDPVNKEQDLSRHQ